MDVVVVVPSSSSPHPAIARAQTSNVAITAVAKNRAPRISDPFEVSPTGSWANRFILSGGSRFDATLGDVERGRGRLACHHPRTPRPSEPPGCRSARPSLRCGESAALVGLGEEVRVPLVGRLEDHGADRGRRVAALLSLLRVGLRLGRAENRRALPALSPLISTPVSAPLSDVAGSLVTVRPWLSSAVSRPSNAVSPPVPQPLRRRRSSSPHRRRKPQATIRPPGLMRSGVLLCS